MPDSIFPELARSLRTLGASRTPCQEEAHTAVFGPLLDARGRAGNDSLEKALAALKGAALFARIETSSVSAISRGIKSPPTARALSADVREMLQPLARACSAMDEAAKHARESGDGLEGWIAALRAVFRNADSACESLARMLTERDKVKASTRWLSSKT
jgi:hypothetical protein